VIAEVGEIHAAGMAAHAFPIVLENTQPTEDRPVPFSEAWQPIRRIIPPAAPSTTADRAAVAAMLAAGLDSIR
jgi:hypothetical protein